MLATIPRDIEENGVAMEMFLVNSILSNTLFNYSFKHSFITHGFTVALKLIQEHMMAPLEIFILVGLFVFLT